MKKSKVACEHGRQLGKCPDCDLDMIAAYSKPMIIWEDPAGPTISDPIYSVCSPETAIKIMQKIHPEMSNQDALDEFLTINWASLELVDMRPFEHTREDITL